MRLVDNDEERGEASIECVFEVTEVSVLRFTIFLENSPINNVNEEGHVF